MQRVLFPMLPRSLAEAAVVQLSLRLVALGLSTPSLGFEFDEEGQIQIVLMTDDLEAGPVFCTLAQGWLEFVDERAFPDDSLECGRDRSRFFDWCEETTDDRAGNAWRGLGM